MIGQLVCWVSLLILIRRITAPTNCFLLRGISARSICSAIITSFNTGCQYPVRVAEVSIKPSFNFGLYWHSNSFIFFPGSIRGVPINDPVKKASDKYGIAGGGAWTCNKKRSQSNLLASCTALSIDQRVFLLKFTGTKILLNNLCIQNSSVILLQCRTGTLKED